MKEMARTEVEIANADANKSRKTHLSIYSSSSQLRKDFAKAALLWLFEFVYHNPDAPRRTVYEYMLVCLFVIILVTEDVRVANKLCLGYAWTHAMGRHSTVSLAL